MVDIVFWIFRGFVFYRYAFFYQAFMPFIYLVGDEGVAEGFFLHKIILTLAEAEEALISKAVDTAATLIKNEFQAEGDVVELVGSLEVFGGEEGDLLVYGGVRVGHCNLFFII